MNEWNLSRLPKLTDEYFAQIISDATAFGKIEFQEIQTPKQFLEAYESYIKLLHKLDAGGLHAYLQTSKNLKDAEAKKTYQRLVDVSAQVSNLTLDFDDWFARLPQQVAHEFAEATQDVHALKKKHEAGKYLLSKPEEKILTLKNSTGANALSNLYNTIASGWSFEVDGKKLSWTELRNLLTSDDRDIRKKAHELSTKKLEEFKDILGDIYIALARDYKVECIDLRKYETPLSVRARSEEISPKAIEQLFSAVRESASIFNEYFAIKAKLLGLPQLEGYDLSAPVGKKQTITIEECHKNVFAAFERLSPKALSQIKTLIEQGYIDDVYHPNKRGGAFNYGISGHLPYVFMQFLGEFDDQFTLAHELGHALHSSYTYTKSPYSSHSPIGIAESASTFMEELLFETLFENASKEEKISLLLHRMHEYYGAICRGAYVSYFEVQAHDKIAKSASEEELTELWTSLTKEQCGPAVNIVQSRTWLAIPHIFESPFYYYNYAVGATLALNLVELSKKDGFYELYEKYLSVGGTLGVVESAKILGIDLESTDSWKTGLGLVRKRLNQLKALL